MTKLSDRDDTLKKLKGLYMKSIVESGELKNQLGEMRQLIQELQTQIFHFRTQQPLKLCIEEEEPSNNHWIISLKIKIYKIELSENKIILQDKFNVC